MTPQQRIKEEAERRYQLLIGGDTMTKKSNILDGLRRECFIAGATYEHGEMEKDGIAFAEWIDNRATRNDNTGLWIHNLTHAGTPITTSELYQLYLKSKTTNNG